MHFGNRNGRVSFNFGVVLTFGKNTNRRTRICLNAFHPDWLELWINLKCIHLFISTKYKVRLVIIISMKRTFRPIHLMVNPEAVLLHVDQIQLVIIVTKCTNGKPPWVFRPICYSANLGVDLPMLCNLFSIDRLHNECAWGLSNGTGNFVVQQKSECEKHVKWNIVYIFYEESRQQQQQQQRRVSRLKIISYFLLFKTWSSHNCLLLFSHDNEKLELEMRERKGKCVFCKN